MINQYQLKKYIKEGFVYVKIRKAIYGLPQAKILANKLLKERLKPHGYYELPHTPGLWKHITQSNQFTLVVDNFGVKYVGHNHVDHLLATIVEQSKQYICYYKCSTKLWAMVSPWLIYLLGVLFYLPVAIVWMLLPVGPTVLCT